ncbi:TIR domain-containing protein [Nocardioides sp. LHD-245]|uniref:TIR domain-containing protein n=1 Tax=Nocardioides sp. LHD-245 TaxID=3051387 RepID=UPI0027E10A5A|nr:TIR domain-containing protein [Nocardioides sp. LHD-245]
MPLPFKVALSGGPYAFVSYAHGDAVRVYPLLAQLHREGYELWYDEGIEPTEAWAESIPRRIDGSNLFIVFGSTVAYSRRGVRMEVDWAFKHGAEILVMQLDDEIALGLDFLSGDEQKILMPLRAREDVFVELRDALARHGITPTPGRTTAPADLPPAARPRTGMPRRQRPRPHQSVTDTFADRVPESEALRTSVEHQLARLRGAVEIADGVFPNVLVFYGQGGRGKTGMSKRMEQWVTGRLPETCEWGGWPHPGVVPVRWDFHDSEGVFPVRDLLLSLRRSLTSVGHRWLALDLALAAYFEAVRGSDGDLGLSGVVADDMLLSLQTVAGQLGMGIPSTLSATSVRRVVNEIDVAGRSLPMFEEYDGLGELFDAIGHIPQGSQAPDVVADLLYLLTQEIFYLPASRRPALVVFVDPFEKIERHGNHALEATIASFVAQLPYALFVVTGRNRLSWADARRTELGHAGAASWPGLAEGATEDPRQHLLGKLSDEDVRRIYDQSRSGAGWDLPDDVVSELVARADGLPLHIDAVLALLHNLERAVPARTYTVADLGGELPQVVVQLLEVLSPEEADAFRAACVLPSFDLDLVTAVAGVSGGAAERAIRYALVEENDEGSIYPFRVHDEIRRLVQLDRKSVGYWSDNDWREAAERGMAEAVRRVEDGHEQGSDAAQIEGTALALRLGYEWDIYTPGLAKIVNDGPSIAALARLVPSPGPEAATDIAALLAFVHACALPFSDAPDALVAIRPAHPEIGAHVDLFTVYRLRSLSRFDEAHRLMTATVERYPDFAAKHHHQYAVTLRSSRRFHEALAYEAEHRPDILDRFRTVIDRLHGLTPGNEADLAYVARQSSRRFRLELMVTNLRDRARVEGVERDEVVELLQRAVDTGHRTAHLDCLTVLGYLALKRDDEFGALLGRVRTLMASYGSTGPAVAHLLALRGLYTQDPDDARRAFDAVAKKKRGSAWIPTEMWLEEIGSPLPPVDTQWLIAPDQVRANWRAVADGIIARAPE